MGYSSITISSGHGTKIEGAIGSGYREHTEAVKVVNRVTQILKSVGVKVNVFEDKTSTSGSTNLSWLVSKHNGTSRQIDVSVHFNSASSSSATGTEVWFYSNDMKDLASKMSQGVANAMGIKNRGAKQSTELYFLRKTAKPAILIEVCFINNPNDMAKYSANFEKVCQAIAYAISGKKVQTSKPSTPTTSNSNIGNITHIGVLTVKGGTINIYSQPNTTSYKGKLSEGSWKVYAVDGKTGMLFVGGAGWVANPNTCAGMTYQQYILVNQYQINVYADSKATTYKRKLQVGSWKIYSIDANSKMICIGNNEWVAQDTTCMKLVLKPA